MRALISGKGLKPVSPAPLPLCQVRPGRAAPKQGLIFNKIIPCPDKHFIILFNTRAYAQYYYKRIGGV